MTHKDHKKARRVVDHYAAHGINSHIVFQQTRPEGLRGHKTTQIAARRGRADEGEAVQLDIQVINVSDKGRTTTHFAGINFTQGTWDALVAWVVEDRHVYTPTKEERYAGVVTLASYDEVKNDSIGLGRGRKS